MVLRPIPPPFSRASLGAAPWEGGAQAPSLKQSPPACCNGVAMSLRIVFNWAHDTACSLRRTWKRRFGANESESGPPPRGGTLDPGASIAGAGSCGKNTSLVQIQISTSLVKPRSIRDVEGRRHLARAEVGGADPGSSSSRRL
jgi:hypothetical protein